MNDLRMIENELVPVYKTSIGEKVVYGSELHAALGVKSPYREWSARRLNDCDAVEDKDFEGVEISTASGQKQKEHIIKLDIAKEMAMLERNQKGKQVRRYFIRVEEKYKENKSKNTIEQGIAVVKFIADDLKVSESSRLFMYENYCKDVGIPTGFLPKYEDNGSRERCCATELLRRNGCNMGASKFNNLLIEAGYIEIKERKSSSKGIKQYKSLTDKGLKYGVNLICNKNQKETQPYYYADTFMELYNRVSVVV